jgi:hypothetical protein
MFLCAFACPRRERHGHQELRGAKKAARDQVVEREKAVRITALFAPKKVL